MAKIEPLTASDIRERLAATTRPGDPRQVVVPAEFEQWPAKLKCELGKSNFKAAGVLIPIIVREQALSVLLTRRATHLKYHAGQVSFPGGSMDPDDADIQATALRETREEIGIRPDEVEIAGFLDPVLTVTGYTVTPVVGLVKPTIRIKIDPAEVERAFEVPLDFLLDEANAKQSERDVDGVRLPIVEFTFAAERIWGATANIVILLRQSLIK